jgi:hypothetical protein
VLVEALVIIGVLALLLFALLINIVVFRKRKEKQMLVRKYKESWNLLKRQAKKFQETNDIQDFRVLQELAGADIVLYKKVQEAFPGYKNTDEYLGAVLDILKGEENYSVN